MNPDEVEKNAVTVLNWADKTIRWAAKTKLRSVFLIATLTVSVITTPYLFLTKLISDNQKFYQERFEKIGYLQEENDHRITLDWINLCIESIKTDHKYTERYCERARERFDKASDNWSPDTKQLIKDEAYEAMKIEVSHYLRSVEFSKLINQKAQEGKILLDTMLSKEFWLFMFGVSIAVYILLSYLINRVRRTLGIRV